MEYTKCTDEVDGYAGKRRSSPWIIDTRFPATDPIWGYVMESARKWGSVSRFDFDKDMNPADRLLGIARDYERRDQFDHIVDRVASLTKGMCPGWDYAKYGGTPGGYEYAETVYKRSQRVNDEYRTMTFYITFGCTENYAPDGSSAEGVRYYVDLKDENGNLFEFFYIGTHEATAERFVGCIFHMQEACKSITFVPDYRHGDEV
jgi:hypothetical protein